MKKEDIKINLEGGQLSISGERSFKEEEKEETFHRVETKYGSFYRSIRLPENVDKESIEASYKDGLLNIKLNKTEDKVKKQIKIK